MKLLADMHIAPRTVQHLRQIGHDVLRVDDILPPTATDTLIIATAKETARVISHPGLRFFRSHRIVWENDAFPDFPSLILSTD